MGGTGGGVVGVIGVLGVADVVAGVVVVVGRGGVVGGIVVGIGAYRAKASIQRWGASCWAYLRAAHARIDLRCCLRCGWVPAAIAAASHACIRVSSWATFELEGEGPRSQVPHASGSTLSRWRVEMGMAPAACARSSEPACTAAGRSTGIKSKAQLASEIASSAPTSSDETTRTAALGGSCKAASHAAAPARRASAAAAAEVTSGFVKAPAMAFLAPLASSWAS